MLENDACGMESGSSSPSAWVSGYSKSGKLFACGSSAAGLIACKKESGSNVLCLESLEDRKAVRFPSNVSTITPRQPGEQADPLQVTLANGQTCSTISHDQAQHYENRRSWLYCGDNGVLLLPKSFDETKGAGDQYFDKSAARWTAQYSVNEAKPTTVGVTKVTYAP